VVTENADKTQLAMSLQRALNALGGLPAARRLSYLVALGIKNRRAEYTLDFGGEAMPEPDSVSVFASSHLAKPLHKLLFVLKHGDDICLDAPTARSITGKPAISALIDVLHEAEATHLVKRTVLPKRELAESDRDSMVGITLTPEGRQTLAVVSR